MDAGHTGWANGLTDVMLLTGSDFCAVAVYEPHTRQIRWADASGNTNERFRHMVIRPGTSLAGEAYRIGRAVQQMQAEAGPSHIHDTLMIAERLKVGAAVPLQGSSNNTKGVLFIGRRSDQAYDAAELLRFETAAKEAWEQFHIHSV